jgi:hypothetical protein
LKNGGFFLAGTCSCLFFFFFFFFLFTITSGGMMAEKDGDKEGCDSMECNKKRGERREEKERKKKERKKEAPFYSDFDPERTVIHNQYPSIARLA